MRHATFLTSRTIIVYVRQRMSRSTYQPEFTMGQRHQVYIRLPKTATNAEQTVGYHNQWSYGTLPVRNVLRIVAYMAAQGFSHDKGFAAALRYFDSDTYKYVMSLDAADQSVSRYYPMGKVMSCFGDALEHQTDESDVLEDPTLGDNNDGITVLDFTPCAKGLPPSYAFVSVDNYGLSSDKTVKFGVPLSGERYLAAYYPQGAASERAPDTFAATAAAFEALGLKVLTQARLKKIFPKMYAKKVTK